MHIDEIISKATRILGNLKENLENASSSLKEQTYLTLTRPFLQHASSMWNPHLYCLINWSGTGPRSATRFFRLLAFNMCCKLTTLGWRSATSISSSKIQVVPPPYNLFYPILIWLFTHLLEVPTQRARSALLTANLLRSSSCSHTLWIERAFRYCGVSEWTNGISACHWQVHRIFPSS